MADLTTITQNAIALLLVVGSGILLAFYPELKDAVIGIVGVVVGFYFRTSSETPAPDDADKQEDIIDMTPAIFVILGSMLIYAALSGKLARVIRALE